MSFLSDFKNYLLSQREPSSKLTVKNYIADVSKFVRWFESKFGEFSAEAVTPQIVAQFRASQTLSPASTERYLSSLRKFFNFLKLEGVISNSPFDQTASSKKPADDPWRLKDFKNYLYVYNASRLTIKNYLIDVKHFLSWAEKVLSLGDEWEIGKRNLFSRINNELIEEYKNRLIHPSIHEPGFSPATVNRKLSSLRRYLSWATQEGLIASEEDLETANVEEKSTKVEAPQAKIKQKTQSAPVSYSKFPPIRLAQRTFYLASFLFDLIFITPHVYAINAFKRIVWNFQGKPVFSEKKAKLSNAIKNLPKGFYAPLAISTAGLPFYKRAYLILHHKRPKWYKTYHSYPLSQYFHYAILIVFMSALGFGLYQNFYKKAGEQGVLAAVPPTGNPRILSFQGKLTDNSDNPITTPTALRFTIYDHVTASGSALKWQEVDTVTPDQDGIFSLILGNNTQLTQDLFAQHAGLWLGVTVGTTPELTPRQQLATVAYAENADTLQGLPPITQPSADTKNVVLALDSSGNLTIGGTATPTFQATGGQFTLSGSSLLLTTTAGSNSDIIASPSGLGKIDLNKPIQNTSNNNNLLTAKGAAEVDDLFAILATSSGQSALTINQNGSGPIISASSSGIAKFTVDNVGNTTIAGNVSLTGTNPTLSVAGTNSFSIDAGGSGAVNIAGNSTGDVNLAGGSGNTGCTIANATGSLTCTGSLSGGSSGSVSAGTFLAGDGSAAVPSYSFTNSQATGLYRVGADILGISTAGTQRATYDASGNYTLTGGNTSLTSTTATGNALSLTDTALTSGTLAALALTSNAGNGQSTKGYDLEITDSTTGGGGYSAFVVNVSGAGTGTGNKFLVDLNPGDVNKEIVVDSTGSLRPTQSVATNTTTIGSPSFYWKNGYFDQITANNFSGNIGGSGTSSTVWTIGDTQTGDVNEALVFQRLSGVGNATLQWNAGTGDLRYLTVNYPFNATYTVSDTSIGTGVNLYSGTLTNNTTSGTQTLLSLTNTGTGTTEDGIYVNNTGTGTTGIEVAGTWGTGILTNSNSINAGTGAITSGAITTSGNFLQTGASTFTTGSGAVALNGDTTVAANKSLAVSGTGTITDSYLNTSGSAINSSVTNTATTGLNNTTNAYNVSLTGTNNLTGSNILNGINFVSPTAATNNTFVGLNFNTGYTTLISSPNFTVTGGGAVTAASYTSTGQFLATNGSAASPSYAFTNSTGTGLFRAGTDILGISTAGTQRITVDASGNVGIGTTNPGTALEVNGTETIDSGGKLVINSNVNSAVTLQFGGTTNEHVLQGPPTQWRWLSNNGSNNNFLFTDSGNFEVYRGTVGIQTAPASNYGISLAGTLSGNVVQDGMVVTVTGNSSATSQIAGIESQPQTAASSFTSNVVASFLADNPVKGAGSTITGAYGYYTNPISVGSTNNYGMYIGGASGATNNYGLRVAGVSAASSNYAIYADAAAQSYFAGNVGIGITNPVNTLSVVGNGLIQSSTNGTAFQVKNAGNTVNELTVDTANDYLYGPRSYLRFAGSGSNTIEASGALELDATSTGYIAFKTTSSETERMRIDNAGNVGIGTTGPQAKLDVNGDTRLNSGATQNAAVEIGSSSSTSVERMNLYSASNTLTATGAITNQRFNFFDQPTITASSAQTITNASTVYIAGAPIAAGSATITNPASLVVAAGNVGIGTTGPSTLLDVNGASTFRGSITQTTGTDALTLSSSATALTVQTNLLVLDTANSRVGVNNGTPAVSFDLGSGTKTAAAPADANIGRFQSRFITSDTANYHFGGLSYAELQAASTNAIQGFEGYGVTSNASGTSAQSNGLIGVVENAGAGTVTSARALQSNITASAGTITNGYGLYIASPTGAGTITNKYAILTELNAGSVGIGTGTQTGLARLEVFTNATDTTDNSNVLQISEAHNSGNGDIRIGVETTNHVGFIQAQRWATGYSNLVINPNGGNVGIGTTSPTALLDVGGSTGAFSQSQGAAIVGSSSGTALNSLLIQNKATQAAGNGGRINFGGSADWIARIEGAFVTAGNGYLAFSTSTSGTITERMRIGTNGNVAINANPDNFANDVLHVEGGVDKEAIFQDNSGTGGGNNYIALGVNNSGNGNAPVIDIQNGKTGGKRNVLIGSTNGLEFDDVTGTSSWIFRTNTGTQRLRITSSTTPATNGVVYGTDANGSLQFTAQGGAGTLCLTSASGGVPAWGACSGSAATAWSSLTNPAGNLSLTMGANTSLFTYNAATGANDLFKLTDTTNNTGTGYLLNITTAAGSAAQPVHIVTTATNKEGLVVDTGGGSGAGIILRDNGNNARTVAFNQDGNAGYVTGTNLGTGASNGFFITGASSTLRLTTDAANPITFSTNNTIRQTIDSSGNITDTGTVTAHQFTLDAGGEQNGITFVSRTSKIYSPSGNDVEIASGLSQHEFHFNDTALVVGETSSGAPLSTQTIRATNGAAGSLNVSASTLIIAGGASTGSGTGGSVKIQTAPAGASGTTNNTLVDRLIIDQNGNFQVKNFSANNGSANGVVYASDTSGTLAETATGGAGTLCLTSASGAAPIWSACSGSAATAWSSLTAPSANLSLSMGTFTTAFTLASSTTAFNFKDNGGNTLLDLDGTNGRVGIGTTSPGGLLSLSKNQDTSTLLNVSNANATTNAYSELSLGNGTNAVHLYKAGTAYSNGANTRFPANSSILEEDSSAGLGISALNASGVIRFYTAGNGERMRIDSTGNVGIGDTNPGSLLSISGGRLRVSGTNSAANSTSILADQTLSDGSGTNVGIISQPTASATINAIEGIQTNTGTAASAITVSSLYNVYIANPRKGAGSTITNNYGLITENLTSGTSNWAIYTSGTTQSYFGGNVGIGITTPQGPLHVALNSSDTTFANQNDATALHIQNTNGTVNTYDGILFETNDSGATRVPGAAISTLFSSTTAGAVSGQLAFFTRNAGTWSEKARFDNAGNFTVGTLAGANGVIYADSNGKLFNTGTGGAGTLCLVSTAGGTPTWSSCAGSATTSWSSLSNPSANLSLSMGNNTTTFTFGAATGASTNTFALTDTTNNTGTGYLLDLTTATGSLLKPLHVKAAGTEAIAVNSAGNVGIGTTSPTTTLTVSGDITQIGSGNNYLFNPTVAAAMTFKNQTRNGGDLFQFVQSNGTATLDIQAGSVGIGTTGPAAYLDVEGAGLTSEGSTNLVSQFVNTAAMGQGVGAGIKLVGKFITASNSLAGFGEIDGVKENSTSTDYASALTFATRVNGGNLTERMRISSAGNVGIGTNNPTNKLQVAAGNISIDAGQQVIVNLGAGGNNYLTSANQANPNFDLYAGNIKKLSLGYGTGATNTFSDGQVIISALNTANGAVYTDSSGQLHTTATGGAGTLCLVSTAGGTPTWGSCAGSAATSWSALTAPSGNLSLAMAGNTTAFTFNSVTTANSFALSSTSISSGDLLDLSINGTAAASNTQKVLNISTAGANGTSTQTTYGGFFSNTHTGTSSTNVGLYSTATSGSNNYAAIFDQGNVGIGTTSPLAKLDISGAGPGNSSTLKLSNTNGKVWQLGEVVANNRFAIYDTAVGERLVIDTNGNVGIGTTSPVTRLHVSAASGDGLAITESSGTVGNNAGTFDLATYTPNAADQRLGYYIFGTRPASTTRSAASMEAYSNAAWTDGTSQPTYLSFFTTAASSATRLERMRIGPAGDVNIGVQNTVANSTALTVVNDGTIPTLLVKTVGGNASLGLETTGGGIDPSIRFMNSSGTTIDSIDGQPGGDMYFDVGSNISTGTYHFRTGSTSTQRLVINNNTAPATNGVAYSTDANGTLQFTATGGAGTLCLTSASGAAPVWSACSGSASTSWSNLSAPSANLSLSMANNTTTFTWGSATGANNLFTLADTTGNTGTGYLLNLATASNSTLKPLHVNAAGTEALVVDQTAKVNIAGNNPKTKFQVGGESNSTTPAQTYLSDYSTTTAYPQLVGAWPTGGALWAIGQATTSADNTLRIGQVTLYGQTWAADTNFKLVTLGSVGIGTASPGSQLDISAASGTRPLNVYQATAFSGTPALIRFQAGISATSVGFAGVYSSTGELLYQGNNGVAITGGSTGVGNLGVYVNTSGNVGIATTSPSQPLDVNGNVRIRTLTNANGVLYTDNTGVISQSATGGAGTLCLVSTAGGVPTWSSCAGSTSTAWSSLSNPSGNLALSMGANTSTFTWGAATGASTNLFNLTDTTSNTGTGNLLNVTTASGSSANPFHVSAAGTEALFVKSNGNVGIGTTTPNALLELNKNQNAGTLIRIDNPDTTDASAYSGITFYQNGIQRALLGSINSGFSGAVGGAGALQVWNINPSPIVFGTNAAERMRIDSTGLVGINQTSPSTLNSQLEVDTSGTGVIGQIIKAQASQTADLLQIRNSVNTVLAKVDNLGNLTANTLTSTVANGTAPIAVTSTTVVNNLYANAAQEPLPNLIQNSDFGRRNKWETFMPELFSDTNGYIKIDAGTAPTVSSNILTFGAANNELAWANGSFIWRDGRASATFKAVSTTGIYQLKWRIDSNHWISVKQNNGNFTGTQAIAGSDVVQATTGQALTLNRWYWLEIEKQGSQAIVKIYDTGGTSPGVSKASSTLLDTLTWSGVDSTIANAGAHISITSDQATAQWGGITTGDGGVYVEGWGPEGWVSSFTGTVGGQAIGFDEAADAGPLGKQWAVRGYIPNSSRKIVLTQITYPTAPSSIPVQPSTSYSASMYVKSSGTSTLNFMDWQSNTCDGSGLGGSVLFSVVDQQEASWTQKPLTATTASTARYICGTWITWNYNSNSAGTGWVDLPQIEQGQIVTPWRNAPSDDGPITWKLYPRIATNITTLSADLNTPLDQRDLAANIFLPWDANVTFNGTVVGTISSGTGDIRTTVEANGANLNPWNSLAGFAANYYNTDDLGVRRTLAFTWQASYSAGKNRFGLPVQTTGGSSSIEASLYPPTLIITATKGKYDLAEEYAVNDQSIEAGDVVSLADGSTTMVGKTVGGYNTNILGIVSTAPGVTLASNVELNSYQQKPDLRPVALQGRIPVKVTNENGPIKRGDALTSSASKPGYAMKATKAGRSIAIAMEDFNPYFADGIQTGKIMAFANLSWYDPDVYLTSTGEFSINKFTSASEALTASSSCQTTTDSSNFGLVNSTCQQTPTIPDYIYKVQDALGNAVDRMQVLSEAVIGTLRAGAINAEDVIAITISAKKVISPLAQLTEVRTNTITNLNSDKLAIKLQNPTASGSAVATKSATLEIQNASGSAVATFDDKGNASLSGQLSANGLNTKDATVSGTLRAKSIQADNIDSALLTLRSQISNFSSYQATSSAATSIASYSAQLANVQNLQATTAVFTQGFSSLGPSSLTDTSVFGQLSVNATLVLAQNSINVLGGDLNFQPLKQGGISFLSGKVYIDVNGNMTLDGNATIKGTLFANVVSPIPGNDLFVKLLQKNATESAQFKVLNASGSAVASIDSEGNGTFKKLNLNLVSPAYALSETEVVASGSAGIATMSANFKEITIDNKEVTDKSLIYITPVGTPSAQVPYLLRQTPGKSFTVGVQNFLQKELPFNWLIIN